MRIRQRSVAIVTDINQSLPTRAVAVYFIDKLALRAGNEKDSDETADTVGCCSLRVEHLSKCCYSKSHCCTDYQIVNRKQ